MRKNSYSYIFPNITRIVYADKAQEMVEQQYHFEHKMLSSLDQVMPHLKRVLPPLFFDKVEVYPYMLLAPTRIPIEFELEKEEDKEKYKGDTFSGEFRVMVYQVDGENGWEELQCISRTRKEIKIPTEDWFVK